jgi:hypothetical protein
MFFSRSDMNLLSQSEKKSMRVMLFNGVKGVLY